MGSINKSGIEESMRYITLATDYDGTLATHGRVEPKTLAALERFRASGRRLVLVTGRHLPDLKSVFPQLGQFDRVVVENGGLLYDPAGNEELPLAEPPPAQLIDRLTERGVPFSTGRTIIATWEPHQTTVIEAIRELGLDSQVIFNKGAVMVLPSGINKASGLVAALHQLELSAHNVVAIGDAENDHAFLACAECGVAVANALPALKQRADWVTEKDHGAGVEELIDQVLKDDLVAYDDRLARHSLALGTAMGDKNRHMCTSPGRGSLLITGASASGKSTIVAGILEQLCANGYQFCLIDPEGDYENFAGALSFGSGKERPDSSVVLNALHQPEHSIIVNLLAVPVADRPGYFAGLLPGLVELRTRAARPHWIVIDEAHHLLPAAWHPAESAMAAALSGTILVTVHPEQISPSVLAPVEVAISTGESALPTLRSLAGTLRIKPPSAANTPSEPGQALVWFRKSSQTAVLVQAPQGKAERRRHRRNYAEGELSPEQSFYFRGPDEKLNLRAQNLNMFLQLADGVDDETWLHHLRNGDYSRWFDEVIKDPELAGEARAIEGDHAESASESKAKIKEAVESRYTLPA